MQFPPKLVGGDRRLTQLQAWLRAVVKEHGTDNFGVASFFVPTDRDAGAEESCFFHLYTYILYIYIYIWRTLFGTVFQKPVKQGFQSGVEHFMFFDIGFNMI